MLLPYVSECVTIYNMFVRTMGIVCDVCDEEIQGIGPEATTAYVTNRARQEGWAVSSAGHFCPDHRRRKGAP
jgi:hypothetical protein